MDTLMQDGGRYHCLPKTVKAKNRVDAHVFRLLRHFDPEIISADNLREQWGASFCATKEGASFPL